MGEFSGIKFTEPDADPDASATWGDYGSAASAGANDLGAWIDAGSRWLAEKTGNEYAEGQAARSERTNQIESDEAVAGMSGVGRKRLEAAVTSEDFWNAPFSATLLKSTRMSPSLAASIIPAVFLPGGALVATAGAATTGGVLSAAQVLDEIYDKVDNASDKELQEASTYYKGLRALGVAEKDARRDYTSVIRENKVLLNFVVGAATNAIGPAGQAARVIKGGTAAVGAGSRGVLTRTGLGTAEGALSEGVEEGVQNVSTQESFIKGGLQKEFDNDQLVNSVLEGGLLGGVFGGAASVKGHGAPHVSPNISPDVTPEVTPGVETVGPLAPDAEQTIALAANEPAPIAAQAPSEAAPEPVAEASRRVAAQQPAMADAEVTPEVMNYEVPPAVAAASGRVAAQPEAGIPASPTVRTPRVLKSLTPEAKATEQLAKEAQAAAKPQLVERVTKGKNWTEAETAKREDDADAAKTIFDEEVPEEVSVPKNVAERNALRDRLAKILKRAEDAGVKIPAKVGYEGTADHIVYLREAKTLHDAMSKKGFVGARATEHMTAFLGREKSAKGGDFSVMRSERKLEGDLAKRRDQGDVETMGAHAAMDAEKEGVVTAVPKSAGGPVRGVSDNTEVAEVKTKGAAGASKVEKIERAVAASPVRKVEITPEAKAKALEAMARLQKKDATPKPSAPEVEVKAPKAAAVKAKVATKVTDKERSLRAEYMTASSERKTQIVKEISTAKKVDAAAKETNTKPSEAQIEAGNYAKGEATVHGLKIAIENPRGSERKGKDANGKEWSVKMPDHYGYVKRTEGADGDQVDVYVGKKPDSQHVFVIDQKDLATGEFDEHKVMLGYEDGAFAMEAYEKAFSDGKGFDRIGKITPMSVQDFKEWLAQKGATKKPAAELEAPVVSGAPTRDRIGIKRDEGRFDIWRVTVNGRVLGDSRGYTKAQALQEARSRVEADPDYRVLDIEGSVAGLEPTDDQIRQVIRRMGEVGAGKVTSWEGKQFDTLQTRRVSEVLGDLDLNGLVGGTAGRVWPLLKKRLIQLVPDVPVHYVDHDTMAEMLSHTPNLKEGTAAYHQVTLTGASHIVVDAEKIGTGKREAHILLHEVTHAATMHALLEDARRGGKVGGYIESIMNEAESVNPLLAKTYGFTNVAEFIAEAMTNPTFQTDLSTIPISGALAGKLNIASWKSAKNAWNAIVDVIRRLLNLPPNYHTALEAAVRVTDWLMHENTRVTQQGFSPINKGVSSAATNAYIDVHSSITDLFTKAEAQEQQGSPRLLKLRTMDQIAQVAENYFGGNNPVRTVVDTIERMRVTGEKLLKGSEPVVTKLYQLEKKYRGAQWEAFTTLVHDETMADVFADRDIAGNTHLGKDTLHGAWGKGKHADLAARYEKLPADLKAARREAMEYFTTSQNKMSLGIIRNRVLKALGIEDDALALRIHENKTTEADIAAVGGQHMMDLILDAKELSKIRGPYFPLMRRGEWVVRGNYKVAAPPKFIRKIDETTWEFATRKEALDWAKQQDARPTVKSAWVDKTTGEKYVKDTDGSEVRITSQDTDAEQRFRVTVQDKHVEFFDTKKEALAAAASMEASEEFRAVAGVEPRRFEPGDRQADMLSHQLQTLVTSLERRPNYQDLSQTQKNELTQALNEASIRFLGSTRIQSKRLPRRYVEGASKDLTRNTLEYAQSSSNYLAKLENQPTLEAAMKAMREGVRNDATKSASIGRGSIANEIEERVSKNNGFVENTKTNQAFSRVLTLSFLDKLFSPAYNIVNSLQPAMVTMPVLGGRHGVGRAFTEMGKAYNDIAGYSIVKQGLRETARKTMNAKDGSSYIEDVKARLTDKLERQMLDHLTGVGSIDPDAGLEIATLIKARDGVMGSVDTGIGYLEGIARQMPKAIETINRTVTALAAYRLEKSRNGGNHDKAVAYAQTTVNNTQGHYSNTNAAPAFNHPLFKLSLQFKKFGQMMYHLLGQQIGKALKNASPGDRAEALKTLAYLTGTHVAMAGTLGLPTEPFKYLLMGLHAVIPGIPGWDDVERWERAAAAKLLGKKAGELATKGLPRAIGIDLSSRVGLDSLISFGEPKSDKKNDVKSYLFDLIAGAPGSLVGDWVAGANALGQGQVGKAAELLTPLKFASDMVKAYRLTTEGKKTDAGRQLATPYSYLEAGARAIGFTPAREAEEGAKAAAFRAQTGKAKTERDGLVSSWVSAQPSAKAKAYADVQKYNRTAPPEAKIKAKDLSDAAKRRKTQGTGVTTTKRTKPTLDKLDQIYSGNPAR